MNKKNSIVIVASGNSSRMGENKLLIDIYGMPVIEKTIQAFVKHNLITEIILVCRQVDILEFSQICNNYVKKKNIKIVAGGNTRTESALNGINACEENTDFIGIHDGARPLINEETITNVITNCYQTNACIPVVPVKDTIKAIVGGICIEEYDREKLFSVQTPQFFSANVIKEATTKAIVENLTFTDDSSLVKHYNNAIYTVEGDYDNIKITTKEDVALAHLIIERRGF